ncbi:MAG: hypothetical protein AAB227_06055 [Pseudomonadota bacterium]
MQKIVILALLGGRAATTGSYAAKLLGVSADTGNVYQIDTANAGSPVLKFSLGAGKDFAGLAFSPVRRTYFAYSRLENKVYEFNKAGAILGIISVDRALTQGFGGPRGIAFDAQGRLYVVGFNNDVYILNISTGKTTLKFRATGPTSELESLAPLDNLAFLAIGVRSQVLVVTRGTGQMTSIASLPVGDLDSMTGTIGGWIYMSESGSNSFLHAYNPFTQSYQSLGWANISHLSSLEELAPNAK